VRWNDAPPNNRLFVLLGSIPPGIAPETCPFQPTVGAGFLGALLRRGVTVSGSFSASLRAGRGAPGCGAGHLRDIHVLAILRARLQIVTSTNATRGLEETVTISASPASARIQTSLGHCCPQSPCIVKVRRKAEFTAYVTARGHQSGSSVMRSVLTDNVAPGGTGNAILSGGPM
jgi:hypothetical protein